MRAASLGFRTDLELLRLGGSTVEDRRDHLVVRSPHNPTHWWGNFLLLPGLPAAAEVESWIDRFTVSFPNAEHVALGFDGTGADPADLEPLRAQGLLPVVSRVMTASSVHRPARWNDAAVYRPLATDADWDQSVELRVRLRDSWHDPDGYRVFCVARTQRYRAMAEKGHGAWFGAFLDGRLVSHMGLFRAGAGLARFQTVETDPEHRRLGLAGSLVHQVGRYGFDELGVARLVIVADPEYHAIDLYRSVGFAATETQLQAERRP
jgi:RimJ/RimL family protein N-acetyltransferase